MISVLVVDDHEVVRTGLASLLAGAADMECVSTAEDGPSALELARRLDPDVVLLDLNMPGDPSIRGREGIPVIRALRTADRPVRVLVLSAFLEPDLVLDVVQAGADGYLLKGSRGEVILDGIRAVAAGQAPVDPQVGRCLLSDLRAHPPHEVLTDREREVLELLRQGHPNKSIARRLQITERTVKAHVTHIFQRIGVSDRTQAALWAERHLHAPSVPGE